jgi:hypothetical protein
LPCPTGSRQPQPILSQFFPVVQKLPASTEESPGVITISPVLVDSENISQKVLKLFF